MTDLSEIQKNHLINIDSLRDYLDKNISFSSNSNQPSIIIKQFTYGQSNPTFYIDYKDKKMVLRKQPPGKLLKTAHSMEREFRIIKALSSVGFPVPSPILFCVDQSIIGTEFYIMDYIEGRIFRDFSLPNYSPNERNEIYSELVRVLAQLHSYDINSLNLTNYGNTKGNYLERQIKTWTKQYKDSETQKINEMDDLIEWLPKNLPAGNNIQTEKKVRIIHGDFRLDNVIFHPTEPKIIAVLDWELSTLGDPIADLSYTCNMYYYPEEFFGIGNIDRGFYGIPSETELKMKYFENSHLKEPSMSEWFYLNAFNFFRIAGICQGVYKRSLQGNAITKEPEKFKKSTIGCAKIGYELSLKSIEYSSKTNRINKLKQDSLVKFLGGDKKFSDLFYEKYIDLTDFMDRYIYPNERKFIDEIGSLEGKNRWNHISSILENLKLKAKELNLWNLFLPEISKLSNLEYAFLCKIMGKSFFLAPEVLNCSAPDTGNMELLYRYANEQQKEKYLNPLLTGEIRSCFSMTEKGVPSSDATNLMSIIKEDPEDKSFYIVNGRKWWISGAGDTRCNFTIFMGRTPNKNLPLHKQHSMIIIPMNTPGVKIIRPMKVFGYDDAPHGHMDIEFKNVRVSKDNIILGDGRGFEIAQGRLGPGRIHHCMRIFGAAERALENMIFRASTRKIFGKLLNQNDFVLNMLGRFKTDLTSGILLVLYAADKIDQVGARNAKEEIAMIKVAAPNIALNIIDSAIQLYGAEGVSQDTFLAYAYAAIRTLRIADGPDEVHLRSLGKMQVNNRSAKF